MASQVNEHNSPSPEGSWNTVSANRKPASTTRPRSKLITVEIQLPPGTLMPKLSLYNLLATIIAAANLSPKTSAEITLQTKPAQSIAFLKTHSPLTAHLLLSLTSLELNGKPITIKPYAPSPPISCLGIIHNVGGHFTSSQLLHDLESFTSDKLVARMMGSAESVLIKFAGTVIPCFVYFKLVSFRCRPHKPKPPTCTRCLAIGHHAHECPQPSVPAKCRHCASLLPADPDAHVATQPWRSSERSLLFNPPLSSSPGFLGIQVLTEMSLLISLPVIYCTEHRSFPGQHLWKTVRALRIRMGRSLCITLSRRYISNSG
ncbi:hypothetical protein HPB51_021483 [Rhipicephalus microplus]|uniref:CCHC-type domain-containing protein n=1 Tax=Rhipicephalus microplus TaxID=6941 RepID=A0A9J6DJ66_RHIMP|nr:hypothetical protein HPB51_021483 [Rhipicephalus microplus]